LYLGHLPCAVHVIFPAGKNAERTFRAGGQKYFFPQSAGRIQFAISIILIITTAIVFQQLRYMQQTSLGYSKDHVIVMPYNIATASQYESFRNELLAKTGVVQVGGPHVSLPAVCLIRRMLYCRCGFAATR
jgi:putative ABC transport system permease protein